MRSKFVVLNVVKPKNASTTRENHKSAQPKNGKCLDELTWCAHIRFFLVIASAYMWSWTDDAIFRKTPTESDNIKNNLVNVHQGINVLCSLNFSPAVVFYHGPRQVNPRNERNKHSPKFESEKGQELLGHIFCTFSIRWYRHIVRTISHGPTMFFVVSCEVRIIYCVQSIPNDKNSWYS